MAVNIDESSRIFTFVIVSDKPKISKNTKITEKPSKDKDNNMSTTDSSPPPTVTNNEQSINGINEKKQNSQETESKQQSVQSIPEVKVNNEPNDDKNLTNETKEQANVEEISTRDFKNNLSIVPPKNTPPQFVSSPSDLTENKIPERPPVSPSKSTGGLFKKFGKIIKNGKESKTEDTITSEPQQITKSEPIPEEAIPAANSNIANVENVENVEKAEDTSIKTDENQKEDNKKDTSEPAKPTRMSSITNMKLFITRTSSSIVEKLKEEFDNLDKKIYPDIEESQREQLMENRDTVSSPKSSEVTNDASQKIQSTQNIMANNLVDLDERGERLEDVGQKTENLKNSASEFARLAAELSKQNEKKSKGWKLW